MPKVRAQKEQLLDACKEAGIEKPKCRILAQNVKLICKGSRTLSKWQQCIKERMKGKKFDPGMMKRLSGEYKAGKCPSELKGT